MLSPLSCFSLFLTSLNLLNQVAAQSSIASAATWLFPLQDGFTINFIDTIILEWTSNYKEAWLMMWCQIDGPGPNVSLGSELQVQPNGTFPYIMFSQNPAQRVFPVPCHAQLVVQPKGTGVDGPVGITWTSRTGVPARTFSLERRAVVSTTTTRSGSAPSSASSSTTKSAPASTVSSPAGQDGDSATLITTATTATGGLATTTPPATSSPPSNPDSNSSITLKLAIGISIGLSFFLIVLSFSVWYFVFRRRKQTSPSEGGTNINLDPKYGRHELEDEPRRLYELQARQKRGHELDGESAVRELAAGTDDEKRRSRKSWKHKSRGKSSIYELP